MFGGIGFVLLLIGAAAADGNFIIAAIMVMAGCMMCLYASQKEKRR